MRRTDVQHQMFEDALAAFKDASKDELTLDSGVQAAIRLNSLVKALGRPGEAKALLKLYRGPTGIADEAAAVHVAWEHGQQPAVERFKAVLRSMEAEDIVRCIERCISTCLTRTERASLVPEAPEVDGDDDDDVDVRPGVLPTLDLDAEDAQIGAQD